MAEIVLHHYATSPYAEKVRTALGVKGLAWRSVTIPNIMPKPDLTALTGGYRKTPVMQIGADVYCDTACILRELERRFPQPSLYPEPVAEIVAGWAEAKTFGPAVGVTFAHIGDKIPQAFKDDRGRFSGRDFDTARMRAALPYLQDQVRAALAVYDATLADGRPFLLGQPPRSAISELTTRCGSSRRAPAQPPRRCRNSRAWANGWRGCRPSATARRPDSPPRRRSSSRARASRRAGPAPMRTIRRAASPAIK